MNNEENNNRPPRRGPGHGPEAVENQKILKHQYQSYSKALVHLKSLS